MICKICNDGIDHKRFLYHLKRRHPDISYIHYACILHGYKEPPKCGNPECTNLVGINTGGKGYCFREYCSHHCRAVMEIKKKHPWKLDVDESGIELDTEKNRRLHEMHHESMILATATRIKNDDYHLKYHRLPDGTVDMTDPHNIRIKTFHIMNAEKRRVNRTNSWYAENGGSERIKRLLLKLSYKRSKQEIILGDIIRSWGFELESQYNNPLWGYSFKVDYYIRDHNVAVEFDGTYFHTLPGRKESDELRSKIIFDTSGIKVIRIPDYMLYKLTKDDFMKLLVS